MADAVIRYDIGYCELTCEVCGEIVGFLGSDDAIDCQCGASYERPNVDEIYEDSIEIDLVEE